MSNDMHSKEPLLIGIGEVLWDLLPGGKALGGAPVNVAAHAAQLGVRAAAISSVGDDPYGQEILDRLRSLRVDLTGIRISRELPTGVVDVHLDAGGVPAFSIRAPAAWDFIEMNTALERLADSADAVVFGSLAQRDPRSRAGIRAFLGAVRPECLKVFDINLRRPFYSPEVIITSLRSADVLKLNEEELPILAGMLELSGDESTLLHAIRSRFHLELLVFTRGHRGSRMITSQMDESHPGCPAQVADTVGAGDAFTAAVTVGILHCLKFERIQELANRIAAFVCSKPGAVPVLPEELRSSLSWGRWM